MNQILTVHGGWVLIWHKPQIRKSYDLLPPSSYLTSLQLTHLLHLTLCFMTKGLGHYLGWFVNRSDNTIEDLGQTDTHTQIKYQVLWHEFTPRHNLCWLNKATIPRMPSHTNSNVNQWCHQTLYSPHQVLINPNFLRPCGSSL